MDRVYLCIDLKSFYASVECAERGLDPFETNLVVADNSRGNGAITLAITPKMKSLGIKNRCRLFEIPKDVTYICAKPRMSLYMKYSADIYSVYLRYISKDDIHVYSIDECFLDITPYMHLYKKSAKQMANMLRDAVYEETGITATAGIGTNIYLCKIALDIIAKKTPDHIGILNEERFKKMLWYHTPLTDFWHIGPGISNHLEKLGIENMHDLAFYNQEILYKEFGINAEYMIDHAWGKEDTTIADIKRYKPKNNSLSNSQILFEDYNYEDALIVLKEMVESNVLNLVDQHLVTDRISVYVGYSKNVGKGSGGQRKLTVRTNSLKILMEEFINLYYEKVVPGYPIRQIAISFQDVLNEYYESYDLFTDYEALQEEKRLNEALIKIKQAYGKNAVLKGMNKLDRATQEKRNQLIGGHNAA